MLPFEIHIQAGQPVQQQVVHAVRRAVVSRQLRAGDPFPSVRSLSQELRINPNTAHRVVAQLVADGILEVRPGVGSVVTGETGGSDRDRVRLLDHQLERIVVEALRLGVDRTEFDGAVHRHWRQLSVARGRAAGSPRMGKP